MNQSGNFRQDEIVVMKHFDKKSEEWIETEYPKVGGRLRIAHEQNETIGISSEVIQYDGNIAVVKALLTTDKGVFSGIGMASLDRDARIAPAILELAETRAIARALRFSGVGVEFCSAEEVSHLDGDNSSAPEIENDPFKQPAQKPIFCPPSIPHGGNGGNGGDTGGNGNNSRLSQKQLSFLNSLAKDRGIEINDYSKVRFGCVASYLSKAEASSLIGELTAN